MFGCDLTNSAHANNRANNILVLGKSLVQGINGTTLYAEHTFNSNFTVTDKTVCLSLHYNGDNSYLFVNNREIVKFKAADSEILPHPLCLGNISKDYNSTNAQKTGLYGYVYDFSVDYRAITNDKIHDILLRYLLRLFNEKKTTSYKTFGLIKKILAMVFLISNVNSLKRVLI